MKNQHVFDHSIKCQGEGRSDLAAITTSGSSFLQYSAVQEAPNVRMKIHAVPFTTLTYSAIEKLPDQIIVG